MAGIFTSPKITPQAVPNTPSITDDSVQKAADDAASARANRGRASTILTNPAQQRRAEDSRQRYLGGA